MKLKNGIMISIAFVLTLCVLYITSLGVDPQTSSGESRKISVIVRENNNETYETIRQGMEQAALDLHVEISFITLTKRNDWQEQISLLEREINNGAEAVILSAANAKELTKAAEEAAKHVPIIVIESPIESTIISTSIIGQDYAMGRALGERLVYTGSYGSKILVIESSEGCENIKNREQGLLDALNGGNAIIKKVKLTDEGDPAEKMNQILNEDTPDILVTLEPYTLSLAANAKENGGYNVMRLYGIGASGRFAPSMERGIIDTAIVQNDFNMGYLSVRGAVQRLNNKNQDEVEIEYAIISNYNMYTKEHQRLLFPFVR